MMTGASGKPKRRIKKPIEKVWAALTVAERLADWFSPVEIDLVVGGRYRILFTDMDYIVEGRILELEPLRRLTHTWPDPETSSQRPLSGPLLNIMSISALGSVNGK